ncbi:hypothetical protein PHSY_002634 [Pseudozyma hubeiensis SY62]|uniref:D-isomer specific 2-hydroxyacid dehydrogenase NAD-binding domain-containing protein n=1 Tax=Pseudozyma hubeiensis (strain SY62) TaxID=1305764 RepID=R9P1J8_PSEHS|nr:hypothetical protein PHSY_002634 [Pseudozyma hubeiensis SY62]GAC95059.1 hypothetical protein PHSY_002634 [Pseudozyma hubeiensis SY62]
MPPTLAPHLTISSTPTPLTTALLFLPTPTHPDPASSLLTILTSFPSIRFVQLPMTGVDQFTPLIRSISTERKIVFCCGKKCFGQVVAEHALALSLSLLRGLHCTPPSTAGEVETLFDARVLIIGSGSIGSSLVSQLQPFRCQITCLDSSTGESLLRSSLETAQLIFLACPLTPATNLLLNAETLAHIHPFARLINVARPQLIHTPSLLTSLSQAKLHSAALDLLTPPPQELQGVMQTLVHEGRLLVTPHSGVPEKLIGGLLEGRIWGNLKNVVEWIDQGKKEQEVDWLGRIDEEKGY